MAKQIRVVSIEPIEYYRRLVTLRDEDGAEYTIHYGEAVSEEFIHRFAPMMVTTKHKKRR
ncbi:hypothetical protein [Paenibacillus sp. HGF5]|uniref:hypothetical protein n=1 Tax=Paenibacillus sp. HGF5 TaxID=908341 RepID=UPI0002072A22|nr:hypothetical protein [Paenibacillus sp. HGF5]EGG36559.1 hypothetical protein HMPREF9412_6587 [Paenibacillus sp. HGF5]